MFAPVRKQQISDLVFEQLRESIYRGELKIGERLPAEREIADSMRVSRSSVRKAIVRLLDLGYVQNRQGLGTFVRLPEGREPYAPFAYVMSPGQSSLDELMEVRIGLECQGVALAAERANEMDIAFLELAFSEMNHWQPDRQKARDADMRFHMGIAYATHNSVHVDLTRRFMTTCFTVSTSCTHFFTRKTTILGSSISSTSRFSTPSNAGMARAPAAICCSTSPFCGDF